jgi:hypothetical protein
VVVILLISYIKVNKNNKIYDINDFWGVEDTNIYGDYTKINGYLFNKYNIIFLKDELEEFVDNDFINLGIKEVVYGDFIQFLKYRRE